MTAARVRIAGPGDEAQILEMMGERMPHPDVERRYAWLYEGNPDGRAITLLASDPGTGEAAGMSSIFPRRVQVHGRTVMGALGSDSWVRPRFRRRGIASLIHAASRFALDAAGIRLMFGTYLPSNSTPLKNAATRDVTQFRRYTRPLLARRLGLLRWTQDLITPWYGLRSRPRLESADPGDARIDTAWAAASGDIGIGTVRDSAFYRWRFQDAPSGLQSAWIVMAGRRVLGACALEMRDRRVRVLDLLAPASHFPQVLYAIVSSIQGADALEIQFTREWARRLGLWRFGFVPREYLPLNVMLSQGASAEASVLHHGASWLASWADTDVDTTWSSDLPARVGQPTRDSMSRRAWHR